MTAADQPHAPPLSYRPLAAALDEIFRLAAIHRPNALALIDPPNRESFTDGPPRRLTYVQAEKAVSAIAVRLRQMRLPDDAVVAVQLPNVVETILTVLGIMRAGFIAAPLPMLWRRSDCVAALSRCGAKAIITCGHIGSTGHCQLATAVASRLFAIRYVCAFGDDLPDGVVGLNDIFNFNEHGDASALPDGGRSNSAARLAIVTFDAGPDGPVPVARTHLQLLAGGLAPLLESVSPEKGTILTAMSLDSFAGLSVALVPWLLTRGTLALHMPFDPQVFAAQTREDTPDLVIVPGVIAPRLAQTGIFDVPASVKAVLAVWRAPERLQNTETWHNADIGLIDAIVFGEIGLLAARRNTDGRPAPLTLGTHTAPRGIANATKIADVICTEAGTLGLCGPMVPNHHFPPGTVRTDLRIADDGMVDTGFPCRSDRDARVVTVTGPLPGTVSVGGYRFALHGLQKLVSLIDRDGTLVALPESLTGHRLAGTAGQRDAVRKTLAELGVNPLIVQAFRERQGGQPTVSLDPPDTGVALTGR